MGLLKIIAKKPMPKILALAIALFALAISQPTIAQGKPDEIPEVRTILEQAVEAVNSIKPDVPKYLALLAVAIAQVKVGDLKGALRSADDSGKWTDIVLQAIVKT